MECSLFYTKFIPVLKIQPLHVNVLYQPLLNSNHFLRLPIIYKFIYLSLLCYWSYSCLCATEECDINHTQHTQIFNFMCHCESNYAMYFMCIAFHNLCTYNMKILITRSILHLKTMGIRYVKQQSGSTNTRL